MNPDDLTETAAKLMTLANQLKNNKDNVVQLEVVK